jgi:hypothetical protein
MMHLGARGRTYARTNTVTARSGLRLTLSMALSFELGLPIFRDCLVNHSNTDRI